MMTITLLGGGNLANHLANVILKSSGCELSQLYNRSIQKVQHFEKHTKITNDFDDFIDTDVYILCISDSAIEEVSKKIAHKAGLIVHTSGALPMNSIQGTKRKGVFYPLQSFTKYIDVVFQSIPICIEAGHPSDFEVLHTLASMCSQKVYKINTSQRKKIHLAAVFVNNFVNHLYSIGKDICDTDNIPFEILQPLIQETAEKINTLAPFEAQTGPAKRKDYRTLEIHKSECSDEIREIYSVFSEAIIKSNSNGN